MSIKLIRKATQTGYSYQKIPVLSIRHDHPSECRGQSSACKRFDLDIRAIQHREFVKN